MSDDFDNSDGEAVEPVNAVEVVVPPPRCVFCGWQRVDEPVTVLGQEFDACVRCVDAGRRLEGYTAFLYVGCLHLMAVEIEHSLAGNRLVPSKALHAFHRRFDDGAYRAQCPCDTCAEVREEALVEPPLLAAFTKYVNPGFKPKVYEDDPDEYEVPTYVLDTFNPDQVFVGPDDKEWTPRAEMKRRAIAARVDSVRPPIKPGSVADRMTPKSKGVHRPDRGGNSWGLADPDRRAVDDMLQKAWWADKKRFSHEMAKLRDLARRQSLLGKWPHVHPDDGSEGSGYYDEGYWVDGETGECFKLPKEF